LALVGVCFGLTEGGRLGWGSGPVAGSLVAGVLLLAAFVGWERRVPDPLLPLGLFAERRFSATNAVTFILYGALGAVLFLLPIQLQQVSGYSPLASGASLLPITVIMLLLSARSGALAARIGPRLQMTVGPIVVAAGVLLLTRVDAGGSYLTEVLPAVLVFGLGLAITVAPLTSTALGSAPPEHSGMASAVNNDVARAGGLIAIAVLPAAAGIGELSYRDPAAFTSGFRTACMIAAGVCAAGGLLAGGTLGGTRRRIPVSAAVPAQCYHCGLDAPPLHHPEHAPTPV
jgi:hypothetical protein